MYPPYRARPASKKKLNSTFHLNYNNIRKFSECSRNSLENSCFLKKNNETYVQHFMYNFLHTLFPNLSAIFENVFIIHSREKGIYDFWVFMAYHHLA